MSEAQIKTFATRCGRLMKEYGPAVVDTFGQQGTSSSEAVAKLSLFSEAARAGGVPPQMFITQPTGVIHYSYFACNESQLDTWQPDGTPVVCTSSKGLFYVMGSLGGVKLAERINAVAQAPGQGQFITVCTPSLPCPRPPSPPLNTSTPATHLPATVSCML